MAHTCVPGCTLDELFARHPPAYREIYDRLVEGLGPVHEDAVTVGVFLKSARKFAEIRPKARSLEVAISLARPVTHPLLARSLAGSGGMVWHVFKLTDPGQVDERLREWLAESCDA
ncbi:DUF5655 domain-containing protein [Thermoactinospora rubra]|uniref:DUF5655 domain-containing protein n=1 Tax=Thermoactinospora rubra TaxID=1088767 RepID=UPI00197E7EDB|nr:DUF5655 domain-containing protein [Thermoactinospora rubra]